MNKFVRNYFSNIFFRSWRNSLHDRKRSGSSFSRSRIFLTLRPARSVSATSIGRSKDSEAFDNLGDFWDLFKFLFPAQEILTLLNLPQNKSQRILLVDYSEWRQPNFFATFFDLILHPSTFTLTFVFYARRYLLESRSLTILRAPQLA